MHHFQKKETTRLSYIIIALYFCTLTLKCKEIALGICTGLPLVERGLRRRDRQEDSSGDCLGPLVRR